MSLQSLKKAEMSLMLDIQEQFGEVTDEQSEALDHISKSIEEKTQTYISMLQNKRIDNEIQILKDEIEDRKNAIKKWEAFQEYAERTLHAMAKDQGGYLEIAGDNGERIGYVNPGVSVTRSVNPDKLNEMDGKYITTLTPQGYIELTNLFKKFFLTDKHLLKVQHIANVSDLSSDHPALDVKVRNTVNFTKKMPKGVTT